MTPPVLLPFPPTHTPPSALPTPISPSPQGSTPCLLSIKIERVRGEEPAESTTSTHAAGSKYHFQLQMSFHRLVLFIYFLSLQRWQIFGSVKQIKNDSCVWACLGICEGFHKNPTKCIRGFSFNKFGWTLGRAGVHEHKVLDQMSKCNTNWVSNSLRKD